MCMQDAIEASSAYVLKYIAGLHSHQRRRMDRSTVSTSNRRQIGGVQLVDVTDFCLVKRGCSMDNN